MLSSDFLQKSMQISDSILDAKITEGIVQLELLLLHGLPQPPVEFLSVKGAVIILHIFIDIKHIPAGARPSLLFLGSLLPQSLPDFCPSVAHSGLICKLTRP